MIHQNLENSSFFFTDKQNLFFFESDFVFEEINKKLGFLRTVLISFFEGLNTLFYKDFLIVLITVFRFVFILGQYNKMFGANSVVLAEQLQSSA